MELDFGGLIWQINKALNVEANRRLEVCGLTGQQMSLIQTVRLLGEDGRPVNQRQLEEAMRLSNPTVTGILRRLEAKGFVTRTADSADRRCKLVSLTARCDMHREETIQAVRAQEERLTKGMTEAEKQLLHDLLERMFRNVDEENA